MRLRIYYPETNGYKDYGGRGIKICDRWESYLNFKEDMGPTYYEGATLDRKDANLDYTPDNCKWATSLEQQRSKRRHLKYKGEFVVDYAKRLGITTGQAVYKLKKEGLLDGQTSH